MIGQRLPDDFETNKWKVLHEGLQAIFSGRQDSISLEVLYRVSLIPQVRGVLTLSRHVKICVGAV